MTTAPRNVLEIAIDDLGSGLAGGALLRGVMPWLAQAMTRCTVFGNFWAAPLCSVFRARALVGLEAVRAGNLVGENVGPNVGIGQTPFPGPSAPWVTAAMPGRKTMRGKLHLIAGNTWATHVVGVDRFDEYSGSQANLNQGVSGSGDYYHWVKGSGTGALFTCTKFATNDTADEALVDVGDGVEFIKVAFNAIHQPLSPLPPDNEPAGHLYSQHPATDPRLDFLRHLDFRLGELVDAAVAAGYVVIVACDNGSTGAGKGTFTEDGLNTPCFVIGDGVPAKYSSRLVQATDFFATIRELRGAPAIATPDSFAFTDEILPDWTPTPPRAFLTCSSFKGLGEPPTNVSRAARGARYKLVDLEGLEFMYDLRNDPEEDVDLLETSLSTEEQAAYADLADALP